MRNKRRWIGKPLTLITSFLVLALSLATACAPIEIPLPFVRATPTVPVAIANPTQTAAPLATTSPSRAVASPTAISATPTPSPQPSAANVEIENAARLQEAGQMKANGPFRLIWSLDGKSLGVITQSGFSLFNLQTFQSYRTLAINPPALLLGLAPDLRVFMQTSDQQTLDLRDTSGGLSLRTIKPGAFIGAVFSPDGKTIATASAGEIAVTLWDAQTGQQTRKLSGFETAAPVYSAQIAADGKTLLWISRGTIQLMDIASGKLGARFQHEDFIFDQALTPEGRTLVTAAEGTVIFWDVASGKKFKINPELNPSSISLSPSGRVLAFGVEKTILLWDVVNQKQLRTLTGHADRVNSVAFAREGLTLASLSEDGIIKIWAVK